MNIASAITMSIAILGLLTVPSERTRASEADFGTQRALLIAQEKAKVERPAAGSLKNVKKLKRAPAFRPTSSRIKPIKPGLRRGVQPAGKLHRPTPTGLKTPPRFSGPGAGQGPQHHLRGAQPKPLTGQKGTAEGADKNAEDKSKVSTKEKKCRPLPPRMRVMMNFNEAEVLEIVQWISKQTCKNFIIGDGIRGGKITILSNTPVTAQEAYRAFLSALNVNNMTVVKVGNFLKIQMKRDAAKDTIPTYIGEKVDIPALDQMVTRVIQLEYVDANTINGTVKQLTSKDGDSYPYAPTNTLIISDTGNNMHRLMEIIKQLDTPLGQEEIRVVQVNYAEAGELAQTLEEIFGQKGASSSRGRTQSRRIQPVRPGRTKTTRPSGRADTVEEGGVTLSKVIADERTNKLIMVAPARAFPKIEDLIKQIDVPIPGEGQIQVVYLEHADSEELASTLTSLASGTTGRHVSPSTIRGKSRSKGAPKAAELFQGEVKVTSDKATNSLVIVANPSDFKSMLKVIKKLDIPRHQVFVEAVIMEVNLDTSKETGLTFHTGAAAQIAGESVPLFFGSQFKAQGSNFNSLAPNISLLGFLGGIRGPELAAEDSILAGVALPSFGVMLEALQTDSNVNVLSTPHILTSDNEEAEIKVGENIPIPAGYGGYGGGLSSLAGLASMAGRTTSSTTSTTTGLTGGYGGYGGLLGGLGMGAINRQEVGLTLKIKPQINEGNVIRLELEEELSEVKDTSNPLGPTTTKRSAKTVVEVGDEQTVVIGGLIREKLDVGETKIPVLGDIPVIGWFFRTRKKQKTKTNLLLFLTPHVIEGPEDFKAIFERKMAEHREFVERFYGEGPEYKSFVDFRKRHGPLADIHMTLMDELSKIENGGSGSGKEIVITPTPAAPRGAEKSGAAAAKDEAAPAKDQSVPAKHKTAPAVEQPPEVPAAKPSAEPSAEHRIEVQ